MEKVCTGYYLYGDKNTNNVITMKIRLKTEQIDKELMQQAFRQAFDLHWNMRTKLIVHNNNYYFVDNEEVFELSESACVTLGKDTKGYLVAGHVEEDLLTIVMSHSLADGSTSFPFIKTVLMNYLTLSGQEDFSKLLAFRKKQFGKKEKYKTLREVENLYDRYQDVTYDYPEHIIFSKKKLGEAVQCYTTLTIDYKKFKQMTEAYAVSTFILFDTICARAAERLGDGVLPVTSTMIMDMRRELGMKYATHEAMAQFSFAHQPGYGKSLEAWAKENAAIWEQYPSTQIALNNLITLLKTAEKFETEDTIQKTKSNLYKFLCRAQRKNQDTYTISVISFVGEHEILSDYVEEVSAFDSCTVPQILIEVQQTGEKVCISISYSDDCICFVDELQKVLVENQLFLERLDFDLPSIGIQL